MMDGDSVGGEERERDREREREREAIGMGAQRSGPRLTLGSFPASSFSFITHLARGLFNVAGHGSGTGCGPRSPPPTQPGSETLALQRGE